MEHSALVENLEKITGSFKPGFSVQPLPQHASGRSYFRVTFSGWANPERLVVMELANGPNGADTSTSCAEMPFINVLNFLRAGDVPVPKLHYYNSQDGLLFLEDFGDETLEAAVKKGDRERRYELYDLALRNLVAMQAFAFKTPTPGCIAYHRQFDFELLLKELHYFDQWFLPERNVTLDREEQEILDRGFQRLAKDLAAMPQLFVHRDYQSRNLMVLSDHMGILDFQDALMGPRPYDLVALLRDSYVVLSDEEVERLIARYIELALGAGLPIDPSTFRDEFSQLTLQRKLKDSGRFVYIHQVKKNPNFLQFVPDSLRYVRWALNRLPSHSDLGEVLTRHVPEIAS